MEKSEFRVLIKHCFLKGKNTVQVLQWLEKCYLESALSKTTVYDGEIEFMHSHTSNFVDKPPNCSKWVVFEEIIKNIHDMISYEPKVIMRRIAKAIGLLFEAIVTTLHKHVHMK